MYNHRYDIDAAILEWGDFTAIDEIWLLYWYHCIYCCIDTMVSMQQWRNQYNSNQYNDTAIKQERILNPSCLDCVRYSNHFTATAMKSIQQFEIQQLMRCSHTAIEIFYYCIDTMISINQAIDTMSNQCTITQQSAINTMIPDIINTAILGQWYLLSLGRW